MNAIKNISKACAVAAICCFGLTTTDASAQLRSVRGMGVDRPAEELFSLQTPYTQPAGSTQLIVGGSHERRDEARNSHIMGRAEYGLTDRIQLQAELPIDIADQQSGFNAQTGVSRASFGATARITEPQAAVALSAGMDVAVPFSNSEDDATGDRPDRGPSYQPSLMAATGIGPMTVHASAKAELDQSERSLKYGVGSMYNAGSWVPSLEVSSKSVEDQRSEYFVTPGVTYKFSESTQLGVGADIGVGDLAGSSNLMAKFSVRLP
jgi:hypothetical protein